MKLWRASYYDPDEGCCVIWAASEREVRRLLARDLEDYKDDAREEGTLVRDYCGPITVERVDVPTGRRGLVEWLNFYLRRDNG